MRKRVPRSVLAGEVQPRLCPSIPMPVRERLCLSALAASIVVAPPGCLGQSIADGTAVMVSTEIEHVVAAVSARVDIMETGPIPDNGDQSYTTYRLALELTPQTDAFNVYTIFGDRTKQLSNGDPANLRLPPAFQVPPPFGTNLGGMDAAFIAINPALSRDSWLTIGDVDGAAGPYRTTPRWYT